MDDLSKQYLAWLERQHDRALNTITSHARTLRSVGNAGTISRDDLQAWWEMRAETMAPGTRAVDLSHLRGFYRWCASHDHRLDDPTVLIRPITVHSTPPNRARKQHLATLLDGDLEPYLKRAVMLGAYAGLRVSESAALDWSDVDATDCTITVRESKGGKSRVVDVDGLLIDWLGDASAGNVVTGGPQQFTAAQLDQRLNRAMKSLGLPITTHSLRHRFGTAAYRASGGDLLAVAEMMGHSSVNTTKVYAAASSDVKKRIAAGVMR
jgi:site-specific recombinase XerD